MMNKKKSDKLYQTYQICVKKGHRLYPYFQELCMNAKNLYNSTNFYIRQIYTSLTQEKELQPHQQKVWDQLVCYIDQMNNNQIVAYQKRLMKEQQKPKEQQKEIPCNLFSLPTREEPFVSYHFLDCLFKTMKQTDYISLPAHVNQGTVQEVFQNWLSFFAQVKDYEKNPAKYTGQPKIPKYKRTHQKDALLTNQVCTIKNQKWLKFPKTKYQLNIGKLGKVTGKLKQVRIIPTYRHYTVEVVLEIDSSQQEKALLDPQHYMGIDMGIDNLATIVTNTGRRPVLVKGKNVKSINQYYNKQKAHLTSSLRLGKAPKEGAFTSKRLQRLHERRHHKIKDIFHKLSYQIIQIAVEENVSTIIIGKNTGWKQKVQMGKQHNQQFCHIPHQMLIRMMTYKAERYGITVKVVEESYTSKASFLDLDEIPVYQEELQKPVFSGKRITRGLYCSSDGTLIHADVNGAYNILRKAVPNAFADGIEGLVRQNAVSTPRVVHVR